MGFFQIANRRHFLNNPLQTIGSNAAVDGQCPAIDFF